MINYNEVIQGTDVSGIWTQLFLRGMKPGNDQLGPTMLRICTDNAQLMVETDSPIRQAIDDVLKIEESPRVRETSSLIFPYASWRSHKSSIDELTSWYVKEFMPRLQAVAPPLFRQTYFERMVDFMGDGTSNTPENNQIKFIIDLCNEAKARGTHFRQSGLQIAIFDPSRDHTRSPQKNFPCLQQIGLHFLEDGGLGLSAYYPTQTIVQRAYGNYLGLCQLGVFIAKQIGTEFREFVCFVGSPRMGGLSKKKLRSLETLAATVQPTFCAANETTADNHV